MLGLVAGRRPSTGCLAALLGVVSGSLAAPVVAADRTVAVSVDRDGWTVRDRAGNGSVRAVLSHSGRYVAFESYADRLVAGDRNRQPDVFVRDLRRDRTQRVSVNAAGGRFDGNADSPSMSSDGRLVAFSSSMPLVRGDTNSDWYFEDGQRVWDGPASDVFVRDRVRRATRRVSVSTAGVQGNRSSWGPALSANGRFVAFTSNARNFTSHDRDRVADVFARDLARRTTRLVSVGVGGRSATSTSVATGISANGRFVAFTSRASNLVPGDTNRADDCFVRDLRRGVTERVSVASDGAQAAKPPWWEWDNELILACLISANGRYVAFDSTAETIVADDGNAIPLPDLVSGGPRFTPMTGRDVFVHDRATRATTRVSAGADGAQMTGLISLSALSSNRRVAFSWQSLSAPPGGSGPEFFATYIRDLRSDTLLRFDNTPSTAEARIASFSGDGRFTAFISSASDLTARDRNNAPDVFVSGPFGAR